MIALIVIFGLLLVVSMQIRSLKQAYDELGEVDSDIIRVSDIAHNMMSIKLLRIYLESRGNSRYLAAETERVAEQTKQRLALSLTELFAVRKAKQCTVFLSIVSILFFVVSMTALADDRLIVVTDTALALNAMALIGVIVSMRSSQKLYLAHLEILAARFGFPSTESDETAVGELSTTA